MTSLLVDTHALLWWRGDYQRLSERAYAAMESTDRLLYFSAVSIWEIAIKRALGRLTAPENLLETMEDRGFLELPVRSRHGMLAGALPAYHGDPFDRMLVAQAQSEKLTLVTDDAQIRAYDVLVLW